MAVEPKPVFSPVPARAFRDHRLTPAHLRLLGLIALHDRWIRTALAASQRARLPNLGADRLPRQWTSNWQTPCDWSDAIVTVPTMGLGSPGTSFYCSWTIRPSSTAPFKMSEM
jgi:hypothetical protein